MNKKILIGIGIAVAIIASVVAAKAMLGDEKTELPMEEQTEKALNLQESSTGSSESGESAEQEYGENEASERSP